MSSTPLPNSLSPSEDVKTVSEVLLLSWEEHASTKKKILLSFSDTFIRLQITKHYAPLGTQVTSEILFQTKPPPQDPFVQLHLGALRGKLINQNTDGWEVTLN